MLRPRRSRTCPLRPATRACSAPSADKAARYSARRPFSRLPSNIRRFARDLPIQFLNPRAQADHLRMLRLHQRALVLIFRLERRTRLAKRLRCRRDFARRPRRRGRPIGAFRSNAAGGRLRERFVQGDERLTLQRTRVGAPLALARAAGVDDPLRLRIGHQLAFGPLEVGAGLVRSAARGSCGRRSTLRTAAAAMC